MRLITHRLSPLVAALCMASSPALHAQLAPGALPSGWNVSSGAAAITRNGNTLDITQGTQQALVNFASFNVGSGALVNISQPNASAALLARVNGGSASQIEGQVKANGALWLINPAGIMIGAGARIDVGSFVASTLNVSDGDFLAGRLTFRSGASPAGEVRNAGTINAASGGSIYLVAPSVTNSGLLNAPNGEVLLAAGQNVQLLDTGTPGVSVSITGAAGDATNLGRIVAEAGRIGIAAGLVSNSGSLSADSAVSEGGRIFLRASGDLRTAATSDISASGTTGGRVELIADGAASVDGRVAAAGSAGQGGYVDTSGQRSLDVVNVPVLGRGGEWHIDPNDIEIVANGPDAGVSSGSAIVSTESGARISAGTITTQLDAGTDVSITTGTGNPATDAQHGDITVSAAIAKTGAAASALTLNANNNIVINAPITSTHGALALNLDSNYQGDYPGVDHAVQLNAGLDLHGGMLSVAEGLGGAGNGTLNIASGTTLLGLPTSAINAATVHVAPGATLALDRAGSAISGTVNNDGTVSVGGTGVALLDHGGTHTGIFDVAATAGLSMSGGHTFDAGTSFIGAGTVEWAGSIQLGADLVFGPGSNPLVLHDTDLSTPGNSTLFTQGSPVAVDGLVTMYGSVGWTHGASMAVTGSGAISAANEGTRFENDGTITTTGTVADVLRGDGAGNSNFVNNGTLTKAGASDQNYVGIASTAGSTIRTDAGSLTVTGSHLGGQLQAATGANLTIDSATLDAGAGFSGAGSITWQNFVTLLGSVDVGADAPAITLGGNTVIQGLGNTLTTRNVVHADGAQVTLLDQTTWNNLGTLSVGPGITSLVLGTGAAFHNQAGGTVQVDQGTLVAAFGAASPNNGAIVLKAGGTVNGNGGDLYNNGSIGGTGNLLLGEGGSGTLFNNGIVAPGDSTSTGTLSVHGNYTQGPGGLLAIKLGGALDAGAFDLLDIDGSAHLAGTLRVDTLPGFAPADAAHADVVVARGSNNGGSFDTVIAPPATSTATVTSLSASYPAAGTGVARVTAAVMPTLGACVAAPGTAGCLNVLPSLSACIANAALPGCSAVLPAPAVCAVSPGMPGCPAVAVATGTTTSDSTPASTPTPPPSADICTIAPNSALCQVLSPPTASEPVKPVQQASNQVVATLVSLAPLASTASTVDADATTGATPAANGATGAGTGAGTSIKKMYCN